MKIKDINKMQHISDNERAKMRRGYPSWHDRPAKKFLKVDVVRKLHTKMPPCNLCKTHKEYHDFPENVFCKHVNNEVSKQRAAKFWVYKRNKHGMKRYLEDLTRKSEP